MKTATVRELRNAFPQVARWIEEGECVEITRSGKPFARLAPVLPTESSTAPMPDFLGRIREQFPDETPGTAIDLMDYDRSDR